MPNEGSYILKFLGSGNAFNTELDNNCAFIKKTKTLFLIDCGSTIFKKIQKYELLNGISEIFVLITHTHPDHVASLGDLIFYSYYISKKKINVIFKDRESLELLLTNMGVTIEMYNYCDLTSTKYIVNEEINIQVECIEEKHVKQLNSYGYILTIEGIKLYYSGDSYLIPENIINMFMNNELGYIYQDTCQEDFFGNSHLSLYKLSEFIKPDLRNRVFCMHLDKKFNVEGAEALGFNVVYNEFK